MPFAPVQQVICGSNKAGVSDIEQADKGNHSVVHCLRTSGGVVLVAAAGLILYYLLAGSSVSSALSAPLISLLAHDGSGGLGPLPKGDDRKYQHTVLPNGLQVVNVQDKRAVQTAFAMAVEAGQYDDPKGLPGLAHFCEHMLFLGTEKYPEASGFDNFMSANGGFNNAYTAEEVTVYFGEMAQAAGKEGLDRFADFFRAPLFDKKYVSKEVHAIDSEHAKNVQDPLRRVLTVALSLANPKSPVPVFHTGDAETLYNIPKKNGVDPVDELKVYFKSHYCPPKMRLVTYGSESLSAQLSEVTKGFGNLGVADDRCKATRKSFASPSPWGKERMGRFVNVKGTLPQAEMWLHFTLPDLSKKYHSQPLNYVEHVLSYGGEDSLGRVLQDNLGLTTSHQTMFDMTSAGTNVFVIMKLTKLGQENQEVLMDVFFSYLRQLRKRGVDTDLYESLASVGKLKWDWAEPQAPSDLASTLAERMTRLPPQHLLSGDSLIDTPNSTLVSSVIEALAPANMNVIYVSSSVKGNSSSSGKSKDEDEGFETLPHYGVKYAVQTLDEVIPGAAKRWNSWLSGKGDLELPKSFAAAGLVHPKIPVAIEGVPKEIPLANMHAKVKGDSDSELYGVRPKKMEKHEEKKLSQELLVQAGNAVNDTGTSLINRDVEVWYRSGWATTSPKVQLQLALRPMRRKHEEGSAARSLRLSVFGKLLAENMVPKMVDLTATGIGYSMDANAKGLTFTFSGFAPMMPTLIAKVLKEFNKFNGNVNATQPSRFKRVTQEIRQGLQTYSEMPITYALQDRNMLLSRGSYSRAESLQALEDVTRESASSSVNDDIFAQPMQLTSLAMGNIAVKEANAAILTFTNGIRTPKKAPIGSGSSLTGEPERIAPVVKIARPVEIRSKNPRAGDPNDAVVLSFVAGVGTVRSRVIVGILGQILSAVAYNELRTARQLGYVVNAGSALVSNVQYVSCIVQGNSLKADPIEASIEYVMTNLMPQRLANLTDKEFASYKDSLRQELLQPPLRFQDEVSHFWAPVAQGGKCFNLRSNMVKYLDESLHSKDALIKEWAKLANPTDGIRRKIAVKYFAGSVPTRPSEDEAAAAWSKEGVDDAAVSLLRREYRKTSVFDHVDSKVREQLAKEGGFFPQELKCELEKSDVAPASAAASKKFLRPTVRHSF